MPLSFREVDHRRWRARQLPLGDHKCEVDRRERATASLWLTCPRRMFSQLNTALVQKTADLDLANVRGTQADTGRGAPEHPGAAHELAGNRPCPCGPPAARRPGAIRRARRYRRLPPMRGC